MLWLKAWLETRWKVVWLLLMGAILFGVLEASHRSTHVGGPQQLLLALLAVSSLLMFVATIMFAGCGIQTGSTRPGEIHKGTEGSMFFTLSLPVTRARLFLVRTAAGLIETAVFVTLVVTAILLLLPAAVSAHDVLGFWALLVGCGVMLYALSACVSTFCDEGWRIRCSALAVVLLYVLSAASAIPRSVNIFIPLISSAPLVTHQIPWDTIVTACVLSVAFLSAGLVIVRKRDY